MIRGIYMEANRFSYIEGRGESLSDSKSSVFTNYDLAQFTELEITSIKNSFKQQDKFIDTPTFVFTSVFMIGFFWYFYISAYFFGLVLTLSIYYRFDKLAIMPDRRYLKDSLKWIAFIPLMNLLIIPFAYDEYRRLIHLHCSAEELDFNFGRNWITALNYVLVLSTFIALILSVNLVVYGVANLHVSTLQTIFGILLISFSILIHFVIQRQTASWFEHGEEVSSSIDLFVFTLFTVLFTFYYIIMPDLFNIESMMQSQLTSIVYAYFLSETSVLIYFYFTKNFSRVYSNSNLMDFSLKLLFLVIILFFTPLYVYEWKGYYTYQASSELDFRISDLELIIIFIHSALLLCFLIAIANTHRNLDLQHQKLLVANGMDTKDESNNVQTESNNLINSAVNSISTPRIEAPELKDLNPTKNDKSNTNPIKDLTDGLSVYEKQELIAKGGMANVYAAINKTTRNKVVWKEAHGDFNPLNVSNMKIDGECELLELLEHPRLPKYIARGSVSADFGQEKFVLIEEFIEGGSLQETIEQCRKMGAIIPQDRIIDLLGKTCEPLIYMATLNEPIYHRDLKPHNIIVHPDRGPVLIDFGLAKIVATGSDISVTRGGSGTWTAPERDSGISGPFTDVYSLGKCLYYLITYKVPPTIVTDREKQEMIQNGAPDWLADLMLNAAWPVHDQRIQTVRHFNEILHSKGNLSFDRSQSISSGDFTTWS